MTDITEKFVFANGIQQYVLEAGNGTPLVLLHGWPQTNFAWRKVMPVLARSHHVVAPDLRGLGRTDKPDGDYDIRTLATDIHALLGELGIEKPVLVGHDWGGLVARRFCLDWPGEARAAAILDVAPHEQVLANLSANSAKSLWHFFFNAVPDLPEKLVAGRADIFLRYLFRDKCYDPETFLAECLDVYAKAYDSEEAFRAGAQYYKAMFGKNRDIDQKEPAKKMVEPLLCLWGTKGGVGGVVDLLHMWRQEAEDVRGCAFDKSGHYLPEEEPGKVVDELNKFFSELGI